jgi:hypothetical protein
MLFPRGLPGLSAGIFCVRYRGIAQPNTLDVADGDRSASTSVRRKRTPFPLRFIVGSLPCARQRSIERWKRAAGPRLLWLSNRRFMGLNHALLSSLSGGLMSRRAAGQKITAPISLRWEP